jgi:hypothetical protein
MRTNQYRGYVSFTKSKSEFQKFKNKIDRYYNWCGSLSLDPQDDENYNQFCESNSVYENG